MSARSPRSPSSMGFVQISNDPANSGEIGIPLSNVRSAASSTGTRRPNQSTFHEVNMSGEDEKTGLFHGPAGRRRAAKDLKRAGTGGTDEFSLNTMGRIYNKIVGFSVITRYLVYIAPVAILLAIPLILLPITGPAGTVDPKDRITLGSYKDANGNPVDGPSLFMLFLWIEVSWLSLWAGKIVARLLPAVFMFFCGVVSSGTRKYATVLRALEIPLSLFFWALASWLEFRFFFQDDNVQWVYILFRILLSLFLSTAVLLAEKTFVQLISITYHQRSFANRIKESKHEIYLLGLMYDASRTLFPMYCPEFVEEDYIINDSIDMMLTHGKRHHKRGGSVTPMRLIGDVGRFGDKITSVFGNIASEITGKQVFNPNSAHSIVVEALEKLRSSEAMARRIWMSFVVEGQESLSVDDIIEVLGPAHREEAEECFASIDADENGDISLDEMIRKVVDLGKERKAIANSMKDIGEALKVFDQVLLFVVLIIVVIIFLAVFQSTFISTLTTAGTALLSLSFVFSVTTQEFLGSCIFLFVKHPYDVGDRVDIAGGEKEQLTVEKISLLYTVFTRIDKMQIVQVPNITLNNLWIENVTRSKAMRETIELNVSFDTSFEDIELLRLEMEKFVRSPDNARDFQQDIIVSVGGVNNLDKLTLLVAIKHKSNWHNDAVRSTRRSKFMCALTLALKRVPIYAPGGGGEALGGPTNPAYSVAVNDDFASRSRASADENKKKARLASQLDSKRPTRTESSVSGKGGSAEARAADELNTRDPMADATEDWGYDNTLNSREGSAERARDIEGIRRELSARDSQQGRRRAGSTLPVRAPGEGVPGLQVTRSSSSAARNQHFDVERQAGNPSPLATYPAAYAATQMASGSGYNVFPVQQPGQPSSSSLQANTARGPYAPQSAQGGMSAAGSRTRGASVSRVRAPPTSQQAGAQGQASSNPATNPTAQYLASADAASAANALASPTSDSN